MNTSLIMDQFVCMNLHRDALFQYQFDILDMLDQIKDADVIITGVIRKEIKNTEKTNIENIFQDNLPPLPFKFRFCQYEESY